MAPLYDLMCTQYYGDDRLAMYIDNIQRTSRLTRERIVNEALRWGMSRARACEVVDDLLEGAPKAIELARDETDGVPTTLVATINDQLARIRSL